jgi:Ca2+-binding EF-hand superfamily protein
VQKPTPYYLSWITLFQPFFACIHQEINSRQHKDLKTMGNTGSTSGGKGSAMAAVAEMMRLTKPQVMEIRKTCAAMASKDGQIRRKLFHIVVAKAGVTENSNADILDLLFTMWDENYDNQVPYLDFVVGIAPLACRYENMNSALKFVLQVMDLKETGKIDSEELITILRSKLMHSSISSGCLTTFSKQTKRHWRVSIVHRRDSRAHIITSTLSFIHLHTAGINRTMSFFGDSVLTENQIYKIADSVFDTITMISSDSEFIDRSGTYKTRNASVIAAFAVVSTCCPQTSFPPPIAHTHRFLSSSECVKTLLHEPLIEQIMAGTSNARANRKKNTNTNTNLNMASAASAVSPSSIASSIKRPRSVTFADWKQREQYDQQQGEKPFERTRLEKFDDESAFSTDQSSIMLTPLNRVRVRVSATTTDSSSENLGSHQVPRVELRGF